MPLEMDTIVQALLKERRRVTAYAAAVVRDVHAADDIFQQVVLAALEVLGFEVVEEPDDVRAVHLQGLRQVLLRAAALVAQNREGDQVPGSQSERGEHRLAARLQPAGELAEQRPAPVGRTRGRCSCVWLRQVTAPPAARPTLDDAASRVTAGEGDRGTEPEPRGG